MNSHCSAIRRLAAPSRQAERHKSNIFHLRARRLWSRPPCVVASTTYSFSQKIFPVWGSRAAVLASWSGSKTGADRMRSLVSNINCRLKAKTCSG